MYVIATKKFRSSRVLLEIILFSHFLGETQMFAGERTATEGVAFAQYRTRNERIYWKCGVNVENESENEGSNVNLR